MKIERYEWRRIGMGMYDITLPDYPGVRFVGIRRSTRKFTAQAWRDGRVIAESRCMARTRSDALGDVLGEISKGCVGDEDTH